MISVYIENKRFYKNIEYVFSVISEVLGIEFFMYNHREYDFSKYSINILYLEDDHNIGVTDDKVSKIIKILNSKELFSDKYMTSESEPGTIMRFKLNEELKGKLDIISIYNSGKEIFINKDKNTITTNIDIVSDIFFMLTRYEEVVFNHKAADELYKRFPAKESIAFKNNFLHRPVVNEHIELLWSFMYELSPEINRVDIWKGKNFAACFTHDVDWIEKHTSIKSLIRNVGRLVVKDRRPGLAFKDFVSWLESKMDFKKDVFWTFDYITEIEERYGFKSTFYFMSGGETSFDNKYKYDDPRVVELIHELHGKGFECGYHGSFNSFNNQGLMKKEKEKLDSIVPDKSYGIRQHFLRFQMPRTIEIQESLGFLYDCSLGYADSEGFRCGICHPYKPYDIIEDRVLDLWILPLMVMETSIMDRRYSGYGKEEAFIKVKSIIDDVSRYSGVFTLLWHNSSFDNNNPSLENWDKIYERIMSYLSERKCLGSSGKEIIRTYVETRKGRNNNG